MFMGEKLKALRLERQLSQAKVAEAIGCSTRAYCHYEAGERILPYDLLKKLCVLFDVSADYLLGLSDSY